MGAAIVDGVAVRSDMRLEESRTVPPSAMPITCQHESREDAEARDHAVHWPFCCFGCQCRKGYLHGQPPGHQLPRNGPCSQSTPTNSSRWGLVTKPEFRNRYVLGAIDGELATVYDDIDSFFEESQSGPVSL